jgi:hypothetical protein
MKKHIFLLIASLFSLSLLSQQNESIIINGKIVVDSTAIEHAHIINKTTLKGTISNKSGVFKLPIRVGDTLFVSHINFEKKEVIVSSKNIANQNILIQLEALSHVLNEVVIKKRKSIFYVDPEIMPEHIVNATTLKLPYANVKATKNEEITNLTFTSVSIDLVNLINSLNGKAKKERELKQAKLKDKRLYKIRKQFTDFFFTDQLNIEKQYINQFLNYCLNSGILYQYKKGNMIRLTELLLKESKTFPHTQIDEDSLLTKH